MAESCDQKGHSWGRWIPLRGDDGRTIPGVEARACGRCHEFQKRPK